MDGTSTRIIIVLADLISDKATELDVTGAFQPALLYGLTEGASKTHDMFAILREGHYYLGYVRTQGVDRALFEVGDESESAKQLLIKHLKSVKGVASRQKRKKGQIELASCLSDEDEPEGKASERVAEPRRKTAAPRKKKKQREEKDFCDASNEESKEYDVNQMVIYTHEDPTVLLVGSVLEVVGYDGYEGEFLLLHRYGYVAKNKAAWKLDYTKSFRPAYHDPKDDLFDFIVKPQSAYIKVEHEIASTLVKAKFELTSKNRVPPGTVLSGKSTSALNMSGQAGTLSEYECKRQRTMEDNARMIASLGIHDLTQQVNSGIGKTTEPRKKRPPAKQGERRRCARLSLVAAGQDDDIRNGGQKGHLPSSRDL